MATSRDVSRSLPVPEPGPEPFLEADVIEEVDVDDDVSAADLTGEALLPTGEVPEPEPPAEFQSEQTSPRRACPLSSGDVSPWERTAPQIDAAAGLVEPATIRAGARLLAAELEDPTGPNQLPDAPEPLTPLCPAEEGLASDGAVLSGDLAAVPLIDVLGLLARQQQTGVLTVSGEGRHIEITLQKGQVALTVGRGFQELRLGRFVVEMEAAAASEIDELVTAPPAAAGEAVPLGARLCQLGYLSREDLRQALARQSQELIYEALRLRSGRFCFFKPQALPRLAVDRSLGADLHLDLEALLLEGYRRIHDWYLLEKELEEGAVYMRADERTPLDRLGLTRDEHQVLQLCTGRNAVSDIARDSRLGALDVVRILQRLQAVNLVRRRVPPQAV